MVNYGEHGWIYASGAYFDWLIKEKTALTDGNKDENDSSNDP
jgi:hypothetical protein